MKIAIVSDIHGNLTALEAVIADIERIQPDLVVHGGDLAASGPRPAECLDRIRELGWPGVLGNTDEMLWTYDAAPDGPSPVIERQMDATRAMVGEQRIAWFQTFQREW